MIRMEPSEDDEHAEQCKSVDYEVLGNVDECGNHVKSEVEVSTKPEKLWANANRYRGTGDSVDPDVNTEVTSPMASMLLFQSLSRNRMLGYVDMASGDRSLITSLTQSHVSQDNLQSISSIGLPAK